MYLRKKTISKNYKVNKGSKEILKKINENYTSALKIAFERLKNVKLSEKDFLNAVKLHDKEYLAIANTLENNEFLKKLTEEYKKKYEDYREKFGIKKIETSKALRLLIKEIEKFV